MLEAPNKPESERLSFYSQVRHTSETLPGVTIDNSFSAISAGTDSG